LLVGLRRYDTRIGHWGEARPGGVTCPIMKFKFCGWTAKHIEEGAPRNLDYSKMRIEVDGTPTEPVLELMRELAGGSGVPISVKTVAAGFNRLPEPPG
jgi:hypothetical protein